MRTYNSSVMDRRLSLRLALSAAVLCAAALLAGISAAPAAEMKSGGGAIGPSQGTVGGGVAGSNRGGAGGVSNPDPGGSAGSFGSPGSSSGPNATSNVRPGYLGGRVQETVPGGDDPTDPGVINPLATDTATARQLGQCDLSATRGLTPEQRIAGWNGRRLQYGSSMIASKAEGRYRGSRYVMLASYQEELGKGRPDAVLAGTYLGIAAETPVTVRAVSELSDALCVPVSADLAERIAIIAEAQRQKLESEGQPAAAASR